MFTAIKRKASQALDAAFPERQLQPLLDQPLPTIDPTDHILQIERQLNRTLNKLATLTGQQVRHCYYCQGQFLEPQVPEPDLQFAYVCRSCSPAHPRTEYENVIHPDCRKYTYGMENCNGCAGRSDECYYDK